MRNRNQFNLGHLVHRFIVVGMVLLLGACSSDSLDDTLTNTDTVQMVVNMSAPGATLATRGTWESETGIDASKTQILIFEVLDNGDEVYRYNAEVVQNKGNRLVIRIPRSNKQERYRVVIIANSPAVKLINGTTKENALNQFTFDLAGKWNSSSEGQFAKMPMWGEYPVPFVVDRDRQLAVLLYMALARVDVGLRFANQNQDQQTNEVEGLDNFKLTSVRVYRTKNKAFVATSADHLSGTQVYSSNIPKEALYNLADGTSSKLIAEADQMPLLYEVDLATNPKGSDKVVGQIYIPESIESMQGMNMETRPCLVVGGYFGTQNIESASPIETFYRMDFAYYKPKTGLVDSYKNILRNHRYVFNINSISSPGFPDEEKALKSIPGNMEVEVLDWNEHQMDFNVQGNMYFGLSNKKVVVPTVDLAADAEKPSDVGANFSDYVWKKVPYRSNISRDKWEMVWESSKSEKSSNFELRVDDKYLWFGALPNVPNGSVVQANVDRVDSLTLHLPDMKMGIHVFQEALNTIYLIDCERVVVNGKYREGQDLNYTHNIQLTLRAPTSVKGKPYSLENMPISVYTETRKGIRFEFHTRKMKKADRPSKEITMKNGRTILVQEYDIMLKATGVPTKDPKDPINPDSTNPDAYLLPLDSLQILTNAVLPFGDSMVGSTTCFTRVVFGYRTKRILTIGSNASYKYGYVLEPNTGSRAFADAAINFGIDQNSTVTVDQFTRNDDVPNHAYNNAFHIEVMTNGSGMSGTDVSAPYLKEKLAHFKPDIILMGYATSFNNEVNRLIADYVDHGGVLIMFTEYYPSAESVNNMVSEVVGQKLNGSNIGLSQDEFLFRLPNQGTRSETDDIILNGPFGDLRGKNWGTDGYALFHFKNFNVANTTVYNSFNRGACFFKHEGPRQDGSNKSKAFVFIGDGGFLSNSNRYIGGEYKGMFDYCPFAINSAYQPIPRTNYLGNKLKEPDRKDTEEMIAGYKRAYEDGFVHNSQLFGNILTWAIDYAEMDGINKGH